MMCLNELILFWRMWGLEMFEELKKLIADERALLLGMRGRTDSINGAMLKSLREMNLKVIPLMQKASPIIGSSSGGKPAVSVSPSSVKPADLKSQSVGTTSFVKSISNKFFRRYAEKLVPSFSKMILDLRRSNLSILPSTYVSMMLFFTTFSFLLAIMIYGGLLFLNMSFWVYFWIVLVLPLFTFFGFYYYPTTEVDSAQKIISYELPFATIHMTAIAGSNIDPINLFDIIASSKEYPHIGAELKRVLVLIRVYGYDVVTSLKQVASRTSNARFSELLGGIASNIGGGGELKTYLAKKAENYLLDYKLERRRYIDLASTFMDIYISILIAAPMVLMLMFIVMNVAGLGFAGLSLQFLLFVSVLLIVVVNILFLVIVNLKQPKT
ncbi:MAG: archaellum biogenesis protein FlaJ (TadC family) [Patescibacteria group bacterium]